MIDQMGCVSPRGKGSAGPRTGCWQAGKRWHKSEGGKDVPVKPILLGKWPGARFCLKKTQHILALLALGVGQYIRNIT